MTIDQIPPHVRNAVIAAEDRDFYSNPGFSISGFARAARDNVLGRESAGGGSTITQQYVKNALVGSTSASLTRKMNELVISAKMARQWSKDEILAAYLNTIYFGRGAYGIDAASKAYFSKPVEELTVAEGAVLAATIQLPSLLDPETNPDRRARPAGTTCSTAWSPAATLDRGRARGHASTPRWCRRRRSTTADRITGPEGLIKAQVLQGARRGGHQRAAAQHRGPADHHDDRPAGAGRPRSTPSTRTWRASRTKLRTAVVSVDPKTGAVRAYYGGEDGTGYDFANAGAADRLLVQGVRSRRRTWSRASRCRRCTTARRSRSTASTISNVEGEQLRHLHHRRGAQAFAEHQLLPACSSKWQTARRQIADMAHKPGIPEDIPGVGPSLTEPDGAGPNNGIVLGQYQARAARHGVGVRDAGRIGYVPRTALRAEGRHRRRHRAARPRRRRR